MPPVAWVSLCATGSPCSGPTASPAGQRRVGGVRGGPGALGVEGDDRVERRVQPLDPGEVRLEQFAGRELAGAHHRGELGRRPEAEIVVGSAHRASVPRPRPSVSLTSGERWSSERAQHDQRRRQRHRHRLRRRHRQLRRPRTAPRTAERAVGPRLRGAHTHPAGGHPAAHRGARSARPGGHGYREDGGLRAAGAPAADRRPQRARRRRPSCWCPPASSPSRCPRRCTATAASWAPGCCPVYGGAPIVRQLRALERGVDVVVATPGRALDLLNRGSTRSSAGRHRRARRGRRDARHGLRRGPRGDPRRDARERQTVLFSATMPRRHGLARPPAPDRPGPDHIGREPRRAGRGAAGSADGLRRPPRGTSRRRSAGSWTSRRRRPRSSSAAPARRSTR